MKMQTEIKGHVTSTCPIFPERTFDSDKLSRHLLVHCKCVRIPLDESSTTTIFRYTINNLDLIADKNHRIPGYPLVYIRGGKS